MLTRSIVFSIFGNKFNSNELCVKWIGHLKQIFIIINNLIDFHFVLFVKFMVCGVIEIDLYYTLHSITLNKSTTFLNREETKFIEIRRRFVNYIIRLLYSKRLFTQFFRFFSRPTFQFDRNIIVWIDLGFKFKNDNDAIGFGHLNNMKSHLRRFFMVWSKQIYYYCQ